MTTKREPTEHEKYLHDMLIVRKLKLFVVKAGVSKTGMTKYMRLFIAPMPNCVVDITWRYAAVLNTKLYKGAGVMQGCVPIKGVGFSVAQHIVENTGAVLKAHGLTLEYEVL